MTGSLKSQNALPAFQLWFDPQYRPSGSGANAPVLTVQITINPGGSGTPITEYYANFALSPNPGYVDFDSHSGSGLIADPIKFLSDGVTKNPDFGNIAQLPTSLNNGSITVRIIAQPSTGITAAAPVLFRTDTAEQQGSVSFLDMPYNFTMVAGMPVTSLNLGGLTLGKALPNIAGTCAAITVEWAAGLNSVLPDKQVPGTPYLSPDIARRHGLGLGFRGTPHCAATRSWPCRLYCKTSISQPIHDRVRRTAAQGEQRGDSSLKSWDLCLPRTRPRLRPAPRYEKQSV